MFVLNLFLFFKMTLVCIIKCFDTRFALTDLCNKIQANSAQNSAILCSEKRLNLHMYVVFISMIVQVVDFRQSIAEQGRYSLHIAIHALNTNVTNKLPTPTNMEETLAAVALCHT
jgi:hypothetical protein